MVDNVAVGVLEDELSVGRIWLKAAARYHWTEAMQAPFTAAADALAWAKQQIADERPWLMVIDIDLPGDELNTTLEDHQRDFERKHPGVAQYKGAVLLSYLLSKHHGRSHLLVVTGQAYGPLTAWLEDVDVSVMFKPVSAQDLRYTLSTLRSKLTDSGREHG